MKKIITSLLILALASFSGLPVSWAATTTSVTASATVPTLTPEFSYQIFRLDRALNPGESVFDVGTDVTAQQRFDFGTLIHTAPDPNNPARTIETGYLYSPNFYCVFIWATGYGRKYQMRSSCSSTAVALTKGFVLTPVYAEQDKFDPAGSGQGPRPAGSLLGNGDGKGMSGVGTNLNIYTSETPSTPRILQAYYSIPRPPASGNGDDIYTGWEGLHLAPLPDGRPAVIPPAGSVSAAVTITIAAI